MGGRVYMCISAVLLVIETVLQFCVVGTHSLSGQAGLFIALLALVVGPIIIVNVVSAINVVRTNDFSGKTCGRTVCIVFHSFQLGVIWRAFTLLVVFETKDWAEYVNMRLFHGGFQSLPFSILLCYEMFMKESSNSLSIVTIVISLTSAAVAFVIHRAETLLHTPTEDTGQNLAVKLPIGVAFLTFSSFLVLTSRSLSIALFSVAETFWIFVPLGLHYLCHFVIECCRPSCRDQPLSCRVLTALYMSFVNIFDMAGKGYSGVKCSYVLFYTIMLVENLTFSFYWMLTAQHGEQFKLFLVLAMLLCFIIGLIAKFASCGCIFNVQSDILSDAFNNPELGGIKDKVKDTENGGGQYDIPDIASRNEVYEIQDVNGELAEVITLDYTTDSDVNVSALSSHFQRGRRSRGQYINSAFVQSQGNLSAHSRATIGSNKMSGGSNRQSNQSKGASSGKKSAGSVQRTPKSKAKAKQGEINPGAEFEDLVDKPETGTDKPGSPFTPSVRHPEKPTIIVSNISKHASLQRSHQGDRSITQTSNGNLTLASSHSKYSRNTHTLHGTLNGSVRKYRYNGFEDPYREAFGKGKGSGHQNRRHHDGVYRNNHHRRFPGNDIDCSLDSSELYPSITSDSSSVSTYTDTNDRQRRRRARQRMDYRTARRRRPRSHDGYSSDVSNSDYLSFNDYSMEDSSSWTESSESSSESAVTWPPSHTANLLKTFNVSDKESSTDNILHWLESMETDVSHDASFSTLHEPSIASDTDMSLSALQTFEVKKEKRKFKKLISKPKGIFLKFSSLNYKGKEKDMSSRQFPLKKNTVNMMENEGNLPKFDKMTELECRSSVITPPPAVPLPGDIVQESIV